MVAILINSLAGGGAEKIALTLAKEFLNKGVDTKLILIEKEQFYELPPGLDVIYLTDKDKITGGVAKFRSIFTSAINLKKIVKQQHLEVVQSHLIRSNYINALASILGAGHKTQIVNHMLASFDKKRGFLGKITAILYKLLYKNVDQIVSISKVMKNDLDQFLKLDHNHNHKVIYNPHEIDLIKSKSKENPELFHFDPDKKYMVSIGRLVYRKRVDLQIQALTNLRSQHENLELLVLGDGEMKNEYESEAKQLGVSAFVHFLGYVQNPYSYLTRADLFVMSSEDEGLPNIIIESLICGTAVVSTDCISGPREILSPESDVNIQLKDSIEITDYGVLTPVGEVHLLAEAIDRVLNDEQLRQSLVEKGKQRAEEFRSSRVAKTYLQEMKISYEPLNV